MTIPFFRPKIGDEEKSAVIEVLSSGWLTTGRRVREFEEKFASYLGVPHAVALNSCTAALHLSLEAAGVREGDIVLVPTMTFAATAEVVRYLSAIPVLVDCDPVTLCMDYRAAATAAAQWVPSGKLKAIIPMHYGGQMAPMAEIQALAQKHGMIVVEDAAHALPAFIRDDRKSLWRTTGSTSPFACFSFYANKCITTGEGGMVTVHDAETAERIRMMSMHGLSKAAWTRFEARASWYYEIIEAGFKYNMSDVAAALGITQLAQVDVFCALRRRVAQLYSSGLASCEEMLELPVELENRKSAWHLYPIRLRLDQLEIDRAEFIENLKMRGITSSVHWMPLHLHPYYRRTYNCQEEEYPIASREWLRLVSLPIFPDMTTDEVGYVCDSIAAIGKKHVIKRYYAAGYASGAAL
jgi:dTDP-4-amino-4,6-dideoxygalactose transaminase